MAEEPKKFTHLAVKPETQRKIAVLATALHMDIYALVEYWAGIEWATCLKSGLVTEAMIETKAHWVGKDAVATATAPRKATRNT